MLWRRPVEAIVGLLLSCGAGIVKVSFQSFLLHRLVIAAIRNTKKLHICNV